MSGRLWEAQFVVFYMSGRLWEAQCVNVSYFTCLEAQNVDKLETFARFWEAQSGSEHGGPVENGRNLGSPRYLGT